MIPLRLPVVFLFLSLGIVPVARAQNISGIDRKVYAVDLVAATKAFQKENGPTPAKTLDAQGNALPVPMRPIPQVRGIEELFQATLDIQGANPLTARTHLYKDPIRIIPYADEDDVLDAAGNRVPRGDAAIAGYYPPGEVGFAIKHHRPLHRTLKLTDDVDDLKEDIKLQDTHIEIVVGVMRGGQPGAITCNSPQDYMEGRFGAIDYPMIFVKPHYPSFVDEATRKLLMENLRTMVVGFNAVSVFPSDYNGGDPLGARDPKRVREHVAMMIRGVAGDQDAKAYFSDDKHKIYCAELAFVSTTASLLVPLNEKHVIPILQEYGDSPTRARQVWTKFQQEITLHNRGEESAFVSMNENKLVRLVRLANDASLADLKPLPDYGDEKVRAMMNGQLAFPPMNMADIIEAFLKIYVPRQELGERIAPTQAALLTAMKPGLREAAAAADQTEAAQKLDQLMDKIIEVVGKSYSSYEEFRTTLAPYLAMARQMTSVRPGDSEGALFVPPMLFHLVSRGDRPGGMISLDYVGHGLHYLLVHPVATTP